MASGDLFVAALVAGVSPDERHTQPCAGAPAGPGTPDLATQDTCIRSAPLEASEAHDWPCLDVWSAWRKIV